MQVSVRLWEPLPEFATQEAVRVWESEDVQAEPVAGVQLEYCQVPEPPEQAPQLPELQLY